MLVIDDTGYIPVTIAGVTITLDAYDAWNRVLEASQAVADGDKPLREFHVAICEMLASYGFGTVSHYAADRFVSALEQAVDALKKAAAAAETPGSPPATGPQPSPSPAA